MNFVIKDQEKWIKNFNLFEDLIKEIRKIHEFD
jgi:hypothetical protein